MAPIHPMAKSNTDSWSLGNSVLSLPDSSSSEMKAPVVPAQFAKSQRSVLSLPDQEGGWAILSGSTVNLAGYNKMRKENVSQVCLFCRKDYVPSWTHLAWHCKHWHELRVQTLGSTLTVPIHLFTQRTGWPAQPCANDENILRWSSQLRKALLDDRYGRRIEVRLRATAA